MNAQKLRLLFLNVGHFSDHLFMLIFAKAAFSAGLAFGLAKDGAYAEMIPYGVPSLILFGAGAPLAAHLADKWNRNPMIAVFFIGIGLASIATSFATSPLQIGIGLAALGVFASIYHPVGIAMVVQGGGNVGWRLGANGVWGNLGVAAAPLITGFVLVDYDWRLAFALPGIVSILIGLGYIGFVRSGQVRPPQATAREKALVGFAPGWQRALMCLALVTAAGGFPMEFNTIAVSDGISMGHEGMRASLVSREIIADSVEAVMHAERFDAFVSFAGCDKSLPGMLMAAARINLPSVFVYGGSILPGEYNGRSLDVVSVFEAVGAHAVGDIDDDELLEIERRACPTIGSCAGMFTANTMAAVGEALGMSLPGSASAAAVDSRRGDVAYASGTAVMQLLAADIRPRQIMTLAAFENAIAIVMALGGSTNAVLHLLAIAWEAGVELALDDFNKVAARVPHVADTKPHGAYHMVDIDRVGFVRTRLDRHGTGRPGSRVEQVLAVELRVRRDVADLRIQRVHFGLQVGKIVGRVGVVGRLNGQLALALQHVGHFVQRAFCGLRHRNAVVRVADALGHAAHLRRHRRCNREAGRVVLGRVDALAGRKAFHCGAHGLGRLRGGIRRLHGADIGVDNAHLGSLPDTKLTAVAWIGSQQLGHRPAGSERS